MREAGQLPRRVVLELRRAHGLRAGVVGGAGHAGHLVPVRVRQVDAKLLLAGPAELPAGQAFADIARRAACR